MLAGLGISPNVTNVLALQLWAKQEGNSKGRGYNWLNTTIAMPGATTLPGNSAHVKNYPSYRTGVKATVQALKGSYYKGIVRALGTKAAQTDRTPYTSRATLNRPALAKIWQAINASPWDGKWKATPGRSQYPHTILVVLNTNKLPATLRHPTSVRQTGTDATGTMTAPSVPCAWRIGVGPINGCVLNENQARALKGGLLLVGGAFVMLVGVGILASFGFGSRAAQSQLRKVGIGGSGGGGQPAPAPQSEEAPAPMTQADRNRQRVASLPPEVREEARRRREAYGLTGSSTRAAAGATPTTPRPAPAERRPRAQPPTGTVTSSGHPSRMAKRPHGRTTGLGPKARARRGR